MMDQPYKEEELFAAASALPASERIRYLKRACGDDIGRFDRLRSLLEKLNDAAHFVNERSTVSRDGAEQIGPYQIVQELGEGGCGVAYLAEQSAPIKRQVALKVIKPGMDTKAVIARFEVERQALAMMDHPNVAKVFDAGTTRIGHPYFVMELIRGVRITDYCNQSRFTVRERLSVFIQVCQAIQHAHLKGIIHRDVKPSNVLVTMHDGAAIAKVIDFGIAKATQGRLTDSTLHTEQFVGTPAYVSPEQINEGSEDIDTRSDLYSLGVLLYELLTGHTPFASSQLSQGALDGLRQRLRDNETLIPSKRLGALTPWQLANAAACCQSSALRLIKEVRGDLDWIVMRCLEKERNRRYQTANDLILDLQRYLDHQPVLARPPELMYVIRKFARRQRVMFAVSLVGIAFVFSIAAFGVVASVQARRIIAERERAEQQLARAEKVSEFMVKAFDAAQPFTSHGREISARELLDEAARRIGGDLNQHPEVRARLLEAIGRSYRLLGKTDQAVTFLQDSLHIRRDLVSTDDASIGAIVTEIAIAFRDGGHIEDSDRYFEEALEISRRTQSQRTEAYALLLVELGRLERLRSNLTQALEYFNEGLELMRAIKGPKDPEVGAILADISGSRMWFDDFDGAEVAARESAEIYKVMPPLHPDRVMADYFLGEVLLYRGRIDEAALLFERVLLAQRKIYGPAHDALADTIVSLAQARVAQNDVREAERLLRDLLDSDRSLWTAAPIRIGNTQTTLAMILIKRAKFVEAEGILRSALDLLASSLPVDHQYIASAEHYLGEALLGQEKYGDAESVLVTAMARWERSGAPMWRSARSASTLGEALHRQGRTREAEVHLIAGFRQLSTDPGADADSRRLARERVEKLYEEQGQWHRLTALLEEHARPRTPAPRVSAKE
jgi:serine/threonine protein kinase/tetratricopeptide (TPR) repeat protein